MDAIDKVRPRDDPSAAVGAPASVFAENYRHDTLRLPKINLPTFSGGYESWRSFHDMFISLVHTNTALSEVQKLHYLKSRVNGEAERLLQHLAINKNNYQKAWEILMERYDHKRVLVNTQLNLVFGQPSFSTESTANIKRILEISQEIFLFLWISGTLS